MSLLAGRIALVTGGANGIGRAIVERFVVEGARVAIVDREPMDEIDGDVVIFPFDLADTQELEPLVREIESSVGPLDVLVNNAGIFESALVTELHLDSYRRVMAINLDAPVFLARAVGRGMIARGYGRVVNITSIHGQVGEEAALAYDTAKAGLNQATRTLAIELGRFGVLVNAIAPGFVSTRLSVVDGENMLESQWFREVYLKHGKLPLRRHAMPAEIASHVAWFASEQNTYVTGQIITVDGGLTATF
jgi:NAD(P)-dependent dehydrogenase (short-subunit alcohol dehydrogenase family)